MEEDADSMRNTMKTIGGALDYARLALLNRPTDRQALAREVTRLVGTGLTPRDVAQALRIDLADVMTMLGESHHA
jgi:hypothetical protein